MKFNSLDHGNEDGKWWGNPQLVTESKEEILELQKLLISEEEVRIVPKSVFNLLRKHGTILVDSIKEKYPEELLVEETQNALKQIESYNENR